MTTHHQHLYGDLIKRAVPHVTSYHSDFYWDAIYLTSTYPPEPGDTFYYGASLSGCGTYIGADGTLIAPFCKPGALWEIAIGPNYNEDNRDYTITELKQ